MSHALGIRCQLMLAAPNWNFSWTGHPQWFTNLAGSAHWLLARSWAGLSSGALTDGLSNRKVSLYVAPSRVSVPREPGGSYRTFYEVALEVIQHHFHHPLLVKALTILPRFNGRRQKPHISTVGVSKNLQLFKNHDSLGSVWGTPLNSDPSTKKLNEKFFPCFPWQPGM